MHKMKFLANKKCLLVDLKKSSLAICCCAGLRGLGRGIESRPPVSPFQRPPPPRHHTAHRHELQRRASSRPTERPSTITTIIHFLLDKDRIDPVMPRYGAAEDEEVYYTKTDYNEARYDLAIYS